jgi:L-2-hydroxyglutarate oxidase
MIFDVVIVGAGIVGLASALKILELNPSLKLLIIEKEKTIATHQTGNNSGVIHSGIYYKPGSLKAQNCVDGYSMLIKFCKKYGIKYEICGKVIAATSQDEIPILNSIYEKGLQNGLKNLKKLSNEEVKEIEPHVSSVAGIFVPQTGIIDFREVACKYLEIILNYSSQIVFNQKVIDIRINSVNCEVITTGQTFESKLVVTCAGLFSDKVARTTHPNLEIKIIPFRGEYYKISDEKKYLVRSLIYPVPDPSFPFLGVHFTRTISGDVEAGPNAVLAFKREGYKKNSFNLFDTLETLSWPGFHKVIKKNFLTGLGEYYRSFSKNAFVKALKRLIPEISKQDLIVGNTGVRAQACSKDGGLLDDFYIVEDKRILHVCNAPSPAATSSLAIGAYIANRIIDRINY